MSDKLLEEVTAQRLALGEDCNKLWEWASENSLRYSKEAASNPEAQGRTLMCLEMMEKITTMAREKANKQTQKLGASALTKQSPTKTELGG